MNVHVSNVVIRNRVIEADVKFDGRLSHGIFDKDPHEGTAKSILKYLVAEAAENCGLGDETLGDGELTIKFGDWKKLFKATQ